MDLLRQHLKLGQEAGEGAVGLGIGQFLRLGEPGRRGNGLGRGVDLGGQIGPLLPGLVLLGQQHPASFTGFVQGFLGRFEGLFGGLDSFILFLEPLFQNREVP
jgi:hypothetical protein